MKRVLRAFISAPASAELGALPEVLQNCRINWEWGDTAEATRTSPPDAIANADLFIGVLTGSRDDRRVLFETGIAAGLRKRVLVLRTSLNAWAGDVPGIKSTQLRLSDSSALKLHVEALLEAPADSIFERSLHKDVKPANVSIPEQRYYGGGPSYEAQIAARLADVIGQAGGAVVHEPENSPKSTNFRPDLLVWLGNQEPELLDPAAVEIRNRVDLASLSNLAERLSRFMRATGVRSSIIVSESAFPSKGTRRWPNIFLLDLNHFEALIRHGRLGQFLREERNKAMHATS